MDAQRIERYWILIIRTLKVYIAKKYSLKRKIMKPNQILFALFLIFIALNQSSCDFLGKANLQNENPRIAAVRIFADNVLEKGMDRWSGQDTPLLVDGINIDTEEPVEWVYEGEHYIIHNLANQQILFRTLAGLSKLTGEDKYSKASKESIRYHFDHLLSECGLLRWGGHQIIDLRTMEPTRIDANSHEFKNHFPFYELMWEVDSIATTNFLRALWNAHILDWSRLGMSRHGTYGLEMGDLWKNEFIQPEPYFEGAGLTFINAGSDLIYAGGMLYLLNGDEGALRWSKLLADQYVRARHPRTGLGAYQYSKPLRRNQPPAEGPLNGRQTWGDYGDRAENQFGNDFPGMAREGWVLFSGEGVYTRPTLIQLELAERLGDNGQVFIDATVEGLKAYARHAYNPDENNFKPMWADGTDLTDYAFPRTGYYGPKGRVLKPSKADELYLFSFSRAYRLSKDEYLWEVLRSMFIGLELGDPGEKPGMEADLNMQTGNSNPYAIFSLLELNRTIDNGNFLKLAEVIGDNILDRSFHHGFFLPDKNYINANFNSLEPLALLSLEAAIRGRSELVPVYSGGRGYIHGQFEGMGRTYDSHAIWSKKRDIEY
jgi:pectate lyase